MLKQAFSSGARMFCSRKRHVETRKERRKWDLWHEYEKVPKLPKREKCGPDEKFLPLIYTKIPRVANYSNNYEVFSLL